jgi:hypothetical protein
VFNQPEDDHVMVETITAYVYKKGKVISVEVWTRPEGSRRLRLPSARRW